MWDLSRKRSGDALKFCPANKIRNWHHQQQHHHHHHQHHYQPTRLFTNDRFSLWLLTSWRGHQHDHILRSSWSAVPTTPLNRIGLSYFCNLRRLRSFQLFAWKVYQPLLCSVSFKGKFLIERRSSLLNAMFVSIAVRCENTAAGSRTATLSGSDHHGPWASFSHMCSASLIRVYSLHSTSSMINVHI